MRSALDKLPYFCTAVTTEEMCDNLVGYGAVYRICFSLAIFYGVFSLLMLNTTSGKDLRVKFHNGFWFLKLVLLVAILVGAFHIPQRTEFGRLLMYVGLTAGFIFIMLQILLVIDFAHSWSFSWGERMESGNSNFWGFALVFSTILVYSMAITMAVFYYLYFTDLQNLSKCRGNMFLISFNVFHCLLASIVSVLPRVQDSAPGSGLLQSSIVSLYTMYLTWCTLSSEPDGSCNPMGDVILEYDKVSGVNGQAILDCVLMFALLIFACNVRSSTSKLEKIGFSLSKYPTREDHYLDQNDAEKYIGEKYVDDENIDLEYNYSFFHFVMFLASLQLMMVVTNWHSPDELADLKKLVKNWATVWIQLSSSFLCVLFYIWATVTPLLVRIWGPCLGLDYESVPTEDDYERLRRRREMLRERKGKDGNLKSRKKERNTTKDGNDFSNSEQMREHELGNLSSVQNSVQEASISKNLAVERRFNTSEQASERKLRNLSLSSVKAQRSGEGIEQITEDSGLCDTTNFTTQSRAVSRETSRGNEGESRENARLEHRSKSALSRETVHNEKTTTDNKQGVDKDKPYMDNVTTHNASLSPEHRAESGQKMPDEKRRNSQASENVNSSTNYNALDNSSNGNDIYSQAELGNLGLNSKSSTLNPNSAQLRLNKYTFSKKQQSRNVRPHSSMLNPSITKKTLPNRPYSSMAFTTKTFREDSKGLKHNLSVDNHTSTIRPVSCEPSLTMQKKTFSLRKKEERTLSFEEGSSMDNTSSSIQQYVQSTVISQEADNIEQELSCVKESVTHRDNLDVLKSTETPVVQNNATLSRSKEEEKCSEDIFSTKDSKTNTNRNNYTPSATTTPLKMQDHLKWVKRLRSTKETLSNKRSISENNAQDVSVEKKAKVTEGKDESKEVLRNVALDDTGSCKINTKFKEQSLKADKQDKSTAREEESMETFVNAFKSIDGSHKQNNTTERNEETLKQSSTLDQSLQAALDQSLQAQKTKCENELQTPDVAKEILRLQQKILKFQAKVVKTQQKIFEMQQEGNL
ncbi:probable serine incorporator [Paramuricea clavata]|uniref:Probable serine incorporator n=1 Tax=Paramuricea clavata TaxID=317549 RepID=A0A7D9IGS6_PARCT|nr:probable serine incorporator [Paramuricea clavata]